MWAAACLAPGLAAAPATAQKKPNIVFIMGDDVGWFNIGAYYRGMMAGKPPNLDRLASEGMIFTMPILVNLKLDPFERTGLTGSLNYYNWFVYQFWRFVQQVVAEYGKTFIEYPPMQKR
jgi:hypothetical protein